jgi:membrane fusion protein, multidrug efflux system
MSFAMVFLLNSCGGSPKTNKPNGGPAATIVDVIVAQPSALSATIEVNGEITANEYVELHPEVSGLLVYLNVAEGANVAQGTVVARVNDADLQAQVARTKVQLQLAKQAEARLKKLLDINGVNQADYDQALGQVETLEADLVYTQTLIDKTVIKAPFTGRLGLRQVSPGAYVTPATAIVSLQQLQQLKVDFSVPENLGTGLKAGDLVEISTDLSDGQRHKARISAIEPQVNRDTRNLKIRAILEGQAGNPGGFAKVYLASSDTVRGVSIPSNAIIPDAMSKKVVTVKGGKAVFVSVETGIRKERLIEVTKGLSPGDTVVVNGVLFARPGAAVQVREVKKLDAGAGE